MEHLLRKMQIATIEWLIYVTVQDLVKWKHDTFYRTNYMGLAICFTGGSSVTLAGLGNVWMISHGYGEENVDIMNAMINLRNAIELSIGKEFISYLELEDNSGYFWENESITQKVTNEE